MANSEQFAKKFVCYHQNCAKSFTDYDKFIRHLSRHKGEKLFECTYVENNIKCGRKFSSARNLKLHQMEHSEEPLPYACAHEGCTRRYKTADALEYHLYSHRGYKPFHCPLCGKPLSSKQSLRNHMNNRVCQNAQTLVPRVKSVQSHN
jgi:uncharacterized Zn-finger protein